VMAVTHHHARRCWGGAGPYCWRGTVSAASARDSALRSSPASKDKATTLLASPPHGPVSYLTPGETEKTAAMLLSDTPLARAWDYWLTRAGFGGIESGMRSTPFVHRTRTICLVA